MKELEKLGIKTPPAVADVERARGLMRTSATATTDLTGAILAGEVTAKNAMAKLAEAARERVEAAARLELTRSVEGAWSKMYHRAVRAEADEILTSLRPVFDAAVADLRKSAEVLGWHPSEKTVLSMGIAASDAWHLRKGSLKTLQSVRSIRVELGASGYGSREQHPSWWVADLKTDVDVERAVKTTGGPAGLAEYFTLRLNSPAEIEAMLAAIEPTQANALAARHAARAAVDSRTDAAWLKAYEADIDKARAQS